MNDYINALASGNARYVLQSTRSGKHDGERFARVDLVCGCLVLATFDICKASMRTEVNSALDNPIYTEFVASPVDLPSGVFRDVQTSDISMQLFDWLILGRR